MFEHMLTVITCWVCRVDFEMQLLQCVMSDGTIESIAKARGEDWPLLILLCLVRPGLHTAAWFYVELAELCALRSDFQLSVVWMKICIHVWLCHNFKLEQLIL